MGKQDCSGNHEGKLCSLSILGQGCFVGLASLLRAEACEEVSAATTIEAWSIPDQLIVDLYKTENSFREWCNKTVFTAELARLIETLINQSEFRPYGLLDILGKVKPITQVLEWAELTKSLDPDKIAFIASSNGNARLNEVINPKNITIKNNGLFDTRLLVLPTEAVENIKKGRSKKTSLLSPESTHSPKEVKTIEDTIPHRTNLSLDGKDPRDSLTLVSGEGVIEESIACFKMLSEIMELPFRRDAIDKSIRQSIGRGTQPSLPMYGQLLTGMGL